MLGKRDDNARLRSDFYRDQLRKIMNWLIGAVAIIFLLLSVIVYYVLFQPPRVYFANTTEGKILKMPRAQVTR